MQDIVFEKDTRKEDIITALLSGQKGIVIDNIEITFKPLSIDTRWSKEKVALKQAEELIKIL